MVNFVRPGVHQFKIFAPIRFPLDLLSWGHREQDAPDKNNNRNNKDAGMTGVIPKASNM